VPPKLLFRKIKLKILEKAVDIMPKSNLKSPFFIPSDPHCSEQSSFSKEKP
jgi:hypothetical protein